MFNVLLALLSFNHNYPISNRNFMSKKVNQVININQSSKYFVEEKDKNRHTQG